MCGRLQSMSGSAGNVRISRRKRLPDTGHHLINALARATRGAALFGNRILCLAQIDDPDLVIPAIGANNAPWNDAEWLTAKRHPEPQTEARAHQHEWA